MCGYMGLYRYGHLHVLYSYTRDTDIRYSHQEQITLTLSYVVLLDFTMQLYCICKVGYHGIAHMYMSLMCICVFLHACVYHKPGFAHFFSWCSVVCIRPDVCSRG